MKTPFTGCLLLLSTFIICIESQSCGPKLEMILASVCNHSYASPSNKRSELPQMRSLKAHHSGQERRVGKIFSAIAPYGLQADLQEDRDNEEDDSYQKDKSLDNGPQSGSRILFKRSTTGNNLVVNRSRVVFQRKIRGIIEECCNRPCSLTEMKRYCSS